MGACTRKRTHRSKNLTILGILLFIFGLLISVALHELGHLIPAKKFGVKVSQYFVGFGPTIFSRIIRGTEYGVKWILLGGYVRLCGMLAPAKAGTRLYAKDGQLTLAEQARRESAAELTPGEAHQAFWRLTPGKKLIVMFGGPFVNFLLAVFFFAIVWLGIGVSTFSNQIGTIAPCLDTAQRQCTGSDVTPAAKSDLHQNDQVVSWDGEKITNWEELQAAIKTHGTGTKNVVVIRDGKTEHISLDVISLARPQVKNGEVVTDHTGEPVLAAQPYVGITPQIVRERQALSELPTQIWNLTFGTVKIVISLPVQLWNIGVSLFTDAPRDPTGVVGLVGIADIASSITSTDNAQYDFAARVADLLLLFASLNMSLFIFNLIPLLPLDGGHILGAMIEWGEKTIAKLRGKPDPGAFDTARLLPLSQVVIFFFLAMTIFLIIADIVKPAI